jgi:hypothetical protein
MPRPEVTGKKITTIGTATATEFDAFSIERFCARHSISVPQYYKMRKLGLTPVEFRVGTRALISRESATVWRRERELAAQKARHRPNDTTEENAATLTRNAPTFHFGPDRQAIGDHAPFQYAGGNRPRGGDGT